MINVIYSPVSCAWLVCWNSNGHTEVLAIKNTRYEADVWLDDTFRIRQASGYARSGDCKDTADLNPSETGTE